MKKIYHHPSLNILLILALSLFFAAGLPKTELDNDIMNFIPTDHPEALAYDRTSEIFGSTMLLSVALEFDRGSLFRPDHIRLIDELSDDFSRLEHVEEVSSITKADFIDGGPEGMEVLPLVSPNFTGTPEEIDAVRRRLVDWDLYRGVFYSPDFSATQILVSFEEGLSDEQRAQLYYLIKETVEEKTDESIHSYIAGNPAMVVLISDYMKSDLVTLIPLVVVVVVAALFLSFRRLGGVLITILTVALSSIWTIGAMGWLGVPLSMVATVIPVLMTAAGSAYGIHIINAYYDGLVHEPEKEHDRIILEAVHRVGRPVLMAGLTTIVGFGALSSSQVVPMRYFGIFTAFGVLAAVVVALLLIPSILLLRSSLAGEKKPSSEHTSSFALMLALFHFFHVRKIRILLFALLIAGLGLYGSSLVIRDNNVIEYFKKDSPFRIAERFIAEKFSGTEFFDIVVQGEKAGDMTRPEALKAMDDIARRLEGDFDEVAKVSSFTDFIKRMNQVMNFPAESPAEIDTGESTSNFSFSGDFEGGFQSEEEPEENQSFSFLATSEPGFEQSSVAEAEGRSRRGALDYEGLSRLVNEIYAQLEGEEKSVEDFVRTLNRSLNYRGANYYEVPYDPDKYPAVGSREELRNLISQYLLLYSGSLERWADDALEPRQARMTVQLLTTGSRASMPVIEAAQRYGELYLLEGYTLETSGSAPVKNALTDLLIDAQGLSIAVSFSLVFLIIALNFRSFVAGFFGIVPMGFAVILNFAVMGFFKIKLDISTAMVASVAIGIGIDYSIHFMTQYHAERQSSDDLEKVTTMTLRTTGKAITFNAFSVAAGFLVLLLSNFNPINYLGLLIALTMFTSSAAAMTLLPAMLNLFKPYFIEKPIGSSRSPDRRRTQ